MPRPLHVALLCHPASPCTAARSIQVTLTPQADGSLTLHYRVEGLAIKLPVAGLSGFADELWTQTCLEAFIRAPGKPVYQEYNFSPSGQWAVYAFSDYRQRDTGFVPAAAPQLTLRADASGFDMQVTLPPACLPAWATPWALGLSAVIEDTTGQRSYWALAHPSPRPDFHHRDAFSLIWPTASPMDHSS